MWLLGIAVIALLLKYFEVDPVAKWSWWWIAGIFALCFIWFEVGERVFGIDKRREAQDSLERTRKERVSALFSGKKKR